MSHRNLLVAAGLALAATAGFGQGTYHEDERNAQQEARIHQGEANGTITPREASRLQAQQHQIRHAERRAAADGVVTPTERARIQRMQNHSSESIQREKDNGHVD